MSSSSISQTRKNVKASKSGKSAAQADSAKPKSEAAKKKQPKQQVEAKDRQKTQRVAAQTDGMDAPKGEKPILDIGNNLATFVKTFTDKAHQVLTGKADWELKREDVVRNTPAGNGTASQTVASKPERPQPPLTEHVNELWDGWMKLYQEPLSSLTSVSGNGSHPNQANAGKQDVNISPPTTFFGTNFAGG
jgi:hypothetical protein